MQASVSETWRQIWSIPQQGVLMMWLAGCCEPLKPISEHPYEWRKGLCVECHTDIRNCASDQADWAPQLEGGRSDPGAKVEVTLYACHICLYNRSE